MWNYSNKWHTNNTEAVKQSQHPYSASTNGSYMIMPAIPTNCLVVCSNNAKSCYYCIILTVAALCLCQLGAPKTGMQSICLYNPQHATPCCLTYGDSIQSQGRQQWATPIAGISQGNGAGP